MINIDSGVTNYSKIRSDLIDRKFNLTDDSIVTASMENIAADIVVRDYADFGEHDIKIDVDIYVRTGKIKHNYVNSKYDRTIHMYDNITDMPDKEFMFINDIITIIGKAVEAHANK